MHVFVCVSWENLLLIFQVEHQHPPSSLKVGSVFFKGKKEKVGAVGIFYFHKRLQIEQLRILSPSLLNIKGSGG